MVMESVFISPKSMRRIGSEAMKMVSACLCTMTMDVRKKKNITTRSSEALLVQFKCYWDLISVPVYDL